MAFALLLSTFFQLLLVSSKIFIVLLVIIFLHLVKIMADNWISILKEVWICIVNEGLWPPVKRHVGCWWSPGDNIKDLRDEIRCLERERRDMVQSIEEARLRAESATSDVKNWSTEGTQKLEEATRILQGYHDLKVWNIISRYSVGKKAKRTAEGLEKLRRDGNLIRIACPAPPPSMVSISDEPSMEFESRRRIEEDIMESLNDDHVHVIAICGAGGVGKTTMAQRIVDRVRKERLFDEVVMVVVSQQIEMRKIQKEIAELLGLSFSENTLVGRAGKLRARLLDSKRKLIIFDDVWESFKLGAIGVPFGNCFTRGKIILTSRVKDVCRGMNAQKIIPMEILTKEEAWILFKEKAGSFVEGSDLLPIAKEVVEECKGLPVSLVTVSKALRDQSLPVWRDALSQLSKSIPTNFPEVIKDVYKPLKWSYDFLENESMKSLFLLCCLFPEDYNIHIEQLTWYSIGLGMLEGIGNIEEGRNRIYSFVEKLKSRFLLIDGRQEHYVKMHDVVRDVAIFIGSKEKHGWLRSLEASSMDSSNKDSSRNCNWMSTDISMENAKLPVWSDFPNLHLLMTLGSIDRKIFTDGKSSKEFDSNIICFKGMKELTVLYFSRLNIRSFPRTLKMLKKLTTLLMFFCEVEDISVVGELASLEILCVRDCSNIRKLPANIGRLNHLKVLELTNCRHLRKIVPGVISSLVGLEELKITGCFDEWEPKGNQSEERNAGLSELESLRSLTCLEIVISDPDVYGQEICLSQQLVRYRINCSDYEWWKFVHEMKYDRIITLSLQGDIPVGHWIRPLVRGAQSLFLIGDGSNNFNLAEIESPRKLNISRCSTMKKLVNAMDCRFPVLEHLHLGELNELEEITYGTIPEGSNCFQKLETLSVYQLPKLKYLLNNQNQTASAGNLESIYISACPNLRYLFSMETARSFVQLQCLQIKNCDTIEQVFWNKTESNTDASIIELPKLKVLLLSHLPNLTAFSQGVEIIECPQLEVLEIEYCPKLRTKIGKCPNLVYIELHTFRGLHHLFSSCSTRKWNSQLQVLVINDGDAIEEILWDEIRDEEKRHIIFQELKELELCELPYLTTFYRGIGSIEFPTLNKLRIRNLPRMKSLAPMDSEPTHDDHSLHLFCNQKVKIPGLKSLVLINLPDITSKIWCRNVPISFFRNLVSLDIIGANCIRNLMSSSIAKNLMNLKDLKIERCPDMVEVIEDEKEVPATSLFPKLFSLDIRGLHELRNFCQWKHAFELPLLDQIKIDDCPRMETFSLGPLNTPRLRKFQVNNEVVELKDLNKDIRDNFMAKRQEEMGNWSTPLRPRKRMRT